MKKRIIDYLNATSLAPTLRMDEAEQLCGNVLNTLANARVHPRSIAASDRSLFFLGRRDEGKFLGIVSLDRENGEPFKGHTETVSFEGVDVHATMAPVSSRNAALLRDRLPFLKARTLGLKKSAGCGDRLGMATPGHIRAIRKTNVAPILAQQSVRENERTGRTPRIGMDDAMWGVFQEGWREGYGADADHLKTREDVDAYAAAEYTFYTIDPGDHVDNEADDDSPETLRHKADALPWEELESSLSDLHSALSESPIELTDFTLTLTPEEVIRAAVKYGRVVAHTTGMHRHLKKVMNGRPFELEISVDETDSITTVAEHVYIAAELKRLGVSWVSLAPRYVGDFEKGVDYIGDVAEFEKTFAWHAAAARTYGPYKLSLHSGSDKFSIYPIASRIAGDLVHVKTAGTSYLEALRAISRLEPDFFRDIMRFAIDRYPEDRATYHVSARVSKLPGIRETPDEKLPDFLEHFHAREILHVTYGSVINHPEFRAPFFDALNRSEELYAETLEAHFDKHLKPFK